MNRTTLITMVVAGMAIGLSACSDTTTPSIISDAQISSDVAASSGDAMSAEVDDMTADEVSVALPSAQPDIVMGATDSVTITRTHVCFDSTSTVVAGCTPLASVRRITFHVTELGFRTAASFTAMINRVRDWTMTRNFSAGVEVSRTHDGVGTSNDSVTFANGTVTRVAVETASDSAQGVTWTLPRANNPFPILGKLVRNVSVHASVQSATKTESRDVTRRVEVDFPADAQGNVVLKINLETCNLNLVTHNVSNCH